MRKYFFLSVFGLLISNSVLLAQESALNPQQKERLEVALANKKEQLLFSYSLSSRYETLKKGDRICLADKDSKTTIIIGNEELSIDGTDVLEVLNVRSRNDVLNLSEDEHIKVLYNGKKFNIPYSDYQYYIKDTDRNYIEQVLNDMRQEAEQEALKARERELEIQKENLAKYYESIAKFKQQQSGPIAVKTKERAYDGTIPFRLFWQKNYYPNYKSAELLSTFLDETFSVHPKMLDKCKDKPDIEQFINDKFGISLVEYSMGQRGALINLRTGKMYRLEKKDDFPEYLESDSYLKVLAQSPDFIYDDTYSIYEVLDPLRFGDYCSEKICDALVGEQVFIVNTLQYDEIESVEKFWNGTFSRYDYNVKLKSGKEYLRREIVGVKWYQQLQKYVGKQVLRVRTDNKFNVNDIYLEDVQNSEPWTVEKIEVVNDNGDNKLNVTIRKGSYVESVDWKSCILLTHDIDFGREYEGVEYPNPLILSYEYMKANTVKMPEYVRQKELARQKNIEALEAELAANIINDMMLGMSLATFLRENPKAKLVNSAVNANGKVAKVYHLGNLEFVFVNGKCTSCTEYQ